MTDGYVRRTQDRGLKTFHNHKKPRATISAVIDTAEDPRRLPNFESLAHDIERLMLIVIVIVEEMIFMDGDSTDKPFYEAVALKLKVLLNRWAAKLAAQSSMLNRGICEEAHEKVRAYGEVRNPNRCHGKALLHRGSFEHFKD